MLRSKFEEEKAAIARDIHDNVSQKLTALAFEVAMLEGSPNDSGA